MLQAGSWANSLEQRNSHKVPWRFPGARCKQDTDWSSGQQGKPKVGSRGTLGKLTQAGKENEL